MKVLYILVMCGGGFFALLWGRSLTDWIIFGFVACWCVDGAEHVLWPVYYRVSPGRLEVLRPQGLSRRLRRDNIVDLTEISILCDFAQGAVHIDVVLDAPPMPRRLIILNPTPEFARALFEAAVSTHKAPPIAGDDLLG